MGKWRSLFKEMWMDDSEFSFCQSVQPYRLKGAGVGVILLELPLKIIIATVLYGGIPLGILLFLIPVAGKEYGDVLAVVFFCVWLIALFAAYTKKTVSCYEKVERVFTYREYILGIKIQEYVWPASAFIGLSHGRHLNAESQAVPGVRLHSDFGQYVLGFMHGETDIEAEEYAKTLSAYSGLDILGTFSTGTQHYMDDIRKFI